MSKEQIEEMANDLDRILCKYVDISPRQYLSEEFWEKYRGMGIDIDLVGIVTDLCNAGYRKQSEGEWESFPSLGNKYRCSHCKAKVESRTNFCPNCGAKMEGGAE